MYDKGMVKEVLNQILKSAKTILKRFEPIKSSDDFLVSEPGLEKLDAICMQLYNLSNLMHSGKTYSLRTSGTLNLFRDSSNVPG